MFVTCSISRYVVLFSWREIASEMADIEVKTNIRDIRSGYPYMHKWLRHLYWNVPAFKDTTEFTHIKCHYTKSHTQVCFNSNFPAREAPFEANGCVDQCFLYHASWPGARHFEGGRGGPGCEVRVSGRGKEVKEEGGWCKGKLCIVIMVYHGLKSVRMASQSINFVFCCS